MTTTPPSRWMTLALMAAQQARGWCSPNPPVGAVVVRNGRVVGTGHTRPAGQEHAEIVALEVAGDAAIGAELYVTLEPCCHHGRTPPCVDAIVSAGIARIVVASLDPNPRVNGGGVARLAAAGLDVSVGDGHDAAAELIEGFTTFVLTGRPMVIAKYAMSLDGRIATVTGHSRWITGSVSREHLHQLRASVDAILVGTGTVLADNPTLTARPTAPPVVPHQPLRVVLDSVGRLPITSHVFDPANPGQTLVATSAAMPAKHRAALTNQTVETLTIGAGPTGLDLVELIAALGQRGITSLMVEGGARTHAAFLEAGLVHKIMAYIAPVIIGGAAAPGPVGGAGVQTMEAAARLTNVTRELLGDDVLVTGYLPSRNRHDQPVRFNRDSKALPIPHPVASAVSNVTPSRCR